jgi:hypothetical protein
MKARMWSASAGIIDDARSGLIDSYELEENGGLFRISDCFINFPNASGRSNIFATFNSRHNKRLDIRHVHI